MFKASETNFADRVGGEKRFIILAAHPSMSRQNQQSEPNIESNSKLPRPLVSHLIGNGKRRRLLNDKLVR